MYPDCQNFPDSAGSECLPRACGDRVMLIGQILQIRLKRKIVNAVILPNGGSCNLNQRLIIVPRACYGYETVEPFGNNSSPLRTGCLISIGKGDQRILLKGNFYPVVSSIEGEGDPV